MRRRCRPACARPITSARASWIRGERASAARRGRDEHGRQPRFGLLYQDTGEPRYLRMLREIEADWQTPPAGDYVRTALAGMPFYQTPKPRWESLHDIQAILSSTRSPATRTTAAPSSTSGGASVAGDRHNTGGFSSGEQATGNPYDPRRHRDLLHRGLDGAVGGHAAPDRRPAVADELELSTLNATLGAQTPSGRWWTYNTPMDGVRKASAHEIVFQAREGSPELNCCSVNGPRSLGMLCRMGRDAGRATASC